MEKPTAIRILDAAEDIFAERGYDGASLGEVSDRVGIRGPSLFNHYKNKRELYATVLERLLDPFFELLDQQIAQPASRQRARASLEMMMSHHVEHPNLARVIQHATLAEGEQFELLVERWFRPFIARIARLAPGTMVGDTRGAADIRASVMAYNNLILGYITLAPLHREILGADPLSEHAIAAQLRLVQRIVDLTEPE
jgi:TetR/AcrR family transcriptional regulator